jgi:starvation-inducible DNA-binding protein
MSNRAENPVVANLQQQLANALVGYLNYKRYHWQSYGPLFRDLHLLFEEQGTAILATIDELGERLRILGAAPVADPRELTNYSDLTISVAPTMIEMIREAQQNALQVIEELRRAIVVASEANDPGTADMFTRFIQVYEKQEWFLRAVLQQNDGFINKA